MSSSKNDSNYPNVYILPQKYASVKDVKISDVIKSFLLNMGKQHSKYHFRFETCLVNSITNKKIVVFKDIQYDGDLRILANIPVPLGLKDEIRIKILRLP